MSTLLERYIPTQPITTSLPLEMAKNDKKGGGGKGKGGGGGGGEKDTGGGKAKGAQSINVRHILVCLHIARFGARGSM